MAATTTFLRPAALLLACTLATGFSAHAQLTITGGTFTVGPATTMSVGSNITVSGSGMLDNQGTIQFTGDLTNTGTIGTGTGLWTMNGSTLQTLTTAGATLATLGVSNAAGVNLGQPITLGALQFTAGPLRLAASTLTLTGGITGLSGTSFVETNGAGLLQMPVSTSAVTFPLGPADNTYRPLTFTRSSGTGTYSARVATPALTAGPSGAPYTANAVNLRWDATPPDATPYDLTAQWTAADELSGFNRALSTLARWNGSGYVPTAYGPATGSNPYQRTNSGLTTGGTFAVLDQSAPLPVELVRFEAQRLTGQPKVLLTWATASELNNAGFEIQRQDEGQTTFRRVGFVAGQGTKSTATSYSFPDANDFQGRSYYRLRQLDLNGTESYSPVRVVAGLPAGNAFSLNLFPNPARLTAALDITGPLPADLTLTLLAADGRLVWQRTQAGPTLTTPFDVSQLAEGTYLLRYQTTDGTHGTLPLVVQR